MFCGQFSYRPFRLTWCRCRCRPVSELEQVLRFSTGALLVLVPKSRHKTGTEPAP
ncbi:hypothetical protein GJAV_G00014880 [Gymnothorax javanicus]|nr:hypothetical protein GJAV_G00014880 [Gymnothorax javanicus]